ncbi:MAG: hypothetical protein ACTSU6_00945 [Candidatus Njordarchaeales archaeon]
MREMRTGIFKKIAKIVYLSLISICIFSSKIHANRRIDPTFNPYIKEFIYISKGLVNKDDFKNISIKFKTYPKNSYVVGTCSMTPWARYVSINKEWWRYNKSQFDREQLVYHEFGHCILYRDHVSDAYSNPIIEKLSEMLHRLGIINKRGLLLEDGCPSSYMDPYVLSNYCISAHYRYYLNELFEEQDSYISLFKKTVYLN